MKKTKKILVTGGTGFVGSYVLRYLVKKGYSNVYSLIRENSKTDLIEDIKDKINFFIADLNDIEALKIAIKNVEIVIHTAAMVSFKSKDRERMMKVNIEGTANVVNICNDNNIEKFIHVSSIASLGRSISGKTISEKTEWTDSKTNSDYAISKYLSEMEVWRAYAEGLPISIINPSLIMGAGYWSVGTGELFRKIYNGLRFYPTGTNGFVDVRDVAEMIITMMEKDITGERFICSGENLKLNDVFSQMAYNFNKKPPSIKLSTRLVSIAAFILDIINLFPGYSSNLTSQSLKNASFDSIYDNTKSKEILGIKYRKLSENIKETSILFKKTYPNKIDFAVFDLH